MPWKGIVPWNDLRRRLTPWLMVDAARDLALSGDERRALHALIKKMGERAVLAELNVSRQALGRALAGLGVRRGTVALVRAGLALPKLQAGLENSTITASDRAPSRGASER